MLSRDLGEGRFRTVHASRSGDVTCFLAHATYGPSCGLIDRSIDARHRGNEYDILINDLLYHIYSVRHGPAATTPRRLQ